MPDPVATPQTTPEDDAVKALEKAGFQDGVVTITDGSQAMPPAELQPAEIPPAPTPQPLDELKRLQREVEELKGLKERAGWADREKERADGERQRANVLEEELKRARIALGAPTKTEPIPLTPEEEAGKRWFMAHLKDMLPEMLSQVPEETLAKHPAFQKRDMAIFMTREELDQTRFLSQFNQEQRDVVQRRILPGLQQARQASGYRKGYSELWDDQKKAFKESAELYGFALPPPQIPGQPPATPTQPAPVSVPPTLSGIPSGVSPTGTKPMPLLSEQDQRLMGLR